MCDKYLAARKIKKLLHRLGFRRSVFHHIIGNSGKLRYIRRYGHSGIHECIEFLENLAGFIAHGADFGYAACRGRKSGCFDIEYDEFIIGKAECSGNCAECRL